MKDSDFIDRSVPVAKAIALAAAACLVGCTGPSGPGRPPSTPYKGDAPWNISSVDPVPQIVAHRAGIAVEA